MFTKSFVKRNFQRPRFFQFTRGPANIEYNINNENKTYFTESIEGNLVETICSLM